VMEIASKVIFGVKYIKFKHTAIISSIALGEVEAEFIRSQFYA